MLALPFVRGLFVILTRLLRCFLLRLVTTVLLFGRSQLPVTAIAVSVPVLLFLFTTAALRSISPRFFQSFLLVFDFNFKVLSSFFHRLKLFLMGCLGLVEALLKLTLLCLLKFGHDRPLKAAPCEVLLLLL